MAAAVQYVTAAQWGAWQGVSETYDGPAVDVALRAASRAIDSYCSRTFTLSDVAARVFVAPAAARLYLPDVASAPSAVTVAFDVDGDGVFETAVAASEWLLEPADAPFGPTVVPYTSLRLVGGRRWPCDPYGRPTVQVTAQWGWPAVPDDVQLAALLLTQRLWKRKETVSGVMGFDGDLGMRISSNDPDIARLLDSHVKMTARFA